jgi:glucosyl-3-phosphoglycerate synthase
MNMTVWEWFERRSYHYRDFAGLALSSDTRAEIPSTTLIFPARNVAGTIGSILTVVERLRARTGLPGQVIVVDGDSPDGTADIARAHGAEVFSENALLPGYGPAQGKGDAMWRALSAATGDIVMFADADTTDFEEHFVYGTLGPILLDPAVQFVKAAYRLPFKQGEEQIPDGGGRVTELMAKPLLNLFYPELAGFAQPLAGEFGGRRSLLEALPFPVGYGVEIAVLIDALRQVGLDALAECDLGRRQNRHQPLRPLGEMAYAVLAAVERRVGERSPAGGHYLRPWDDYAVGRVPIEERPPLESLRLPAHPSRLRTSQLSLLGSFTTDRKNFSMSRTTSRNEFRSAGFET